MTTKRKGKVEGKVKRIGREKVQNAQKEDNRGTSAFGQDHHTQPDEL
jgi:hypothetical protein